MRRKEESVAQFVEGEERVEWFGQRHAHSYVSRNGMWQRGRCLVVGPGVCTAPFNSAEFAQVAAHAQSAQEWLQSTPDSKD